MASPVLRFQSSPALKDRCNPAGKRAHSSGLTVSILTGLERPVQPCGGESDRKGILVSILTGLERPVQRLYAAATKARQPFQSSPALKDRCNSWRRASTPPPQVSILTGLERPVQHAIVFRVCYALGVSILTGLERPVQPEWRCKRRMMIVVSILTGLERPVQLSWRRASTPPPQVSILTGLERPVQPSWGTSYAFGRGFQSSPALKDRCNSSSCLP